MSRPISITDVINHITPSHNRIAKFIMSTLKLEEKLAHPEKQSVYFRWAMRNNEKYHRWTTDDYVKLREEFNEWSIDDLIAAKEEEKRVLREKVPTISPRFSKAFMRGACISRINKYNDYLSVKSITVTLPPWEDLKDDPELLRRILTME